MLDNDSSRSLAEVFKDVYGVINVSQVGLARLTGKKNMVQCEKSLPHEPGLSLLRKAIAGID